MVSSVGSQAFLDKNAGNNKTVRASGVTIQDSGNADVSANYNIRYVDNFAGSIEKILLESVVYSPVKQVNSYTSNLLSYVPLDFSKPVVNAMASSPVLVLPEGLQKLLGLPLLDSLHPVDSNADNKER